MRKIWIIQLHMIKISIKLNIIKWWIKWFIVILLFIINISYFIYEVNYKIKKTIEILITTTNNYSDIITKSTQENSTKRWSLMN